MVFEPEVRAQQQSTQYDVPGLKLDEEKLDLTLFPPKAMEAISEVLMHGAKKYDRNNWRKVVDAEFRYYAALRRHLQKFEEGEDIDPSSGLHHLAHAATNLCILLALPRDHAWRRS
jgi:hypothetical protein